MVRLCCYLLLIFLLDACSTLSTASNNTKNNDIEFSIEKIESNSVLTAKIKNTSDSLICIDSNIKQGIDSNHIFYNIKSKYNNFKMYKEGLFDYYDTKYHEIGKLDSIYFSYDLKKIFSFKRDWKNNEKLNINFHLFYKKCEQIPMLDINSGYIEYTFTGL